MPYERIFARLGQAVVPCLFALAAAALVAHLRLPVETTTLVALPPSSSLASAVSVGRPSRSLQRGQSTSPHISGVDTVSTGKGSSDRRKHDDNLTKTLAALRRELRLKKGKSRMLRQQALSPLVFYSCMYPARMRGFHAHSPGHSRAFLTLTCVRGGS